MTYEMSPNIAIYVDNMDKARAFYIQTLGFEEVPSVERWVELRSGPNCLFLMESSSETGAVHELFVDDLEATRTELLAQGCEIVRWEGKDRDCYIKDPFGVLFNIWEK